MRQSKKKNGSRGGWGSVGRDPISLPRQFFNERSVKEFRNMTRKHFLRRVSWTVVALQTGLALVTAAAPGEPPQALLTLANPNVRAIIAVQNAKTPDLMANPDVIG